MRISRYLKKCSGHGLTVLIRMSFKLGISWGLFSWANTFERKKLSQIMTLKSSREAKEDGSMRGNSQAFKGMDLEGCGTTVKYTRVNLKTMWWTDSVDWFIPQGNTTWGNLWEERNMAKEREFLKKALLKMAIGTRANLLQETRRIYRKSMCQCLSKQLLKLLLY